ncbi:MAG: M23 family peptidase [Acidobacteria bacterium]|nr:MAG: M23 family peptidase [Acidobacteriota bacterium]REK08392.1 MAG: M23 family peptidase [Acidobacteriota bacterium]
MSPASDFRSLSASPRSRRSGVRSRLLAVPIALFALIAVLAVWRVGSPPVLELRTNVPGIGSRTEITAVAEEAGRGLGTVVLELVQAERRWELARTEHEPRPFWAFWGERTARVELPAVVEGRTVEGLAEGEALLRLVASRAPTWLRRPAPEVLERTLPVRWRPPSVNASSQPNYVGQGGSGLVVYTVGEAAVRHGVEVGDRLFEGSPVPGRAGEFFALYAAPYDLETGDSIRLFAEDALRNASRAPFLTLYQTRELVRSTIALDDAFLQKVVPAIAAETAGLRVGDDLLAGYLEINGPLRRANAEELRRLAAESRETFLWSGVFLQQPNAQVMDRFAARRQYTYRGEVVDQQDHLGLDLASTRQAEVLAANSGVVVMARYFGIYGRTVVVDHGHGLMSLYAHLSSIAVEPGAEVATGQTLGRTGATGLAGGDHLHFTVLLGGEPVTPLEWFDAQWIRNRIEAPLGGAGAAGAGAAL